MIVGPQNDIIDLWINPRPLPSGQSKPVIPPTATSIGSLTTDGTEVNSGAALDDL